MSFSADVDWRRVPWWFWLIVIFQCRIPVLAGMRLIMHEAGGQPVNGEALVTILISLPACLMSLLFVLQVTRAALCQVVVMLMAVASLADIVLQCLQVMNNGLPEPLWPLMLLVALDSGCVLILTASGRLGQVFWRSEEYED
ncbi:hypothetical protein DEI20_24180 [Salmonella enterica subsp. enterica serovar Newport]|nr:hypothetical protein [Salmonella enterica subsp. enterica serovar Newport]MJR82399.1 hypothetical protein [Salmonella enterica subsp. enterica serovar Newport]